jgi:N-acetylmuramoyl-L-alanine amidase
MFLQALKGLVMIRSKFLFIIILIFFGLYNTQRVEAQKTKVVVIDAGHGGKDPGAAGKYSKEKNITLSVALKVGKYLKQNVKNIKVIYTRTTDVFVPLDERAEIANRNKADLFVSIHVNSTLDRSVQGCETYVMGLHKSKDNLAVAMKENSSIRYEKNYKSKYSGYDPDSPEAYIVMSLFQNAYLDMSLDLAEKMQYQYRERARRKDMGVRQAGFLVLWRTTMPSVLTEIGFISNRKEERFLNSQYGQDIIASAIYRAIRDYLKEH